MRSYSFLNVSATISGPGAVGLNMGAGSANSEEGITIESVEDKNTMTIGADGKGMHSLNASDARKIVVRLLKTSPVNGLLMALYNLQSSSSSLWGQNVIAVTDSGNADGTIIQGCAFKKVPTLTYAKEAGFNEWEFDGIAGTSILGL